LEVQIRVGRITRKEGPLLFSRIAKDIKKPIPANQRGRESGKRDWAWDEELAAQLCGGKLLKCQRRGRVTRQFFQNAKISCGSKTCSGEGGQSDWIVSALELEGKWDMTRVQSFRL